MTVGEALIVLGDVKKYPNRNEPCFILRGRDPLAEATITYWKRLALLAEVPKEKRLQAGIVAVECAAWAPKKLPD